MARGLGRFPVEQFTSDGGGAIRQYPSPMSFLSLRSPLFLDCFPHQARQHTAPPHCPYLPVPESNQTVPAASFPCPTRDGSAPETRLARIEDIRALK